MDARVLVITTALVVLTRTVIGRQIYAVGGNAKAAKLFVIKTERLAFLTFVNMACWRRLPASSLPRGSTRRRRRPTSVSNSTSLPPASSGSLRLWRRGARRRRGGRRADHGRDEQPHVSGVMELPKVQANEHA